MINFMLDKWTCSSVQGSSQDKIPVAATVLLRKALISKAIPQVLYSPNMFIIL